MEQQRILDTVIQYGGRTDGHLTSEGVTMAPKKRDGSVGQETYAAVNKLVEGGMSRTDAFNQVAMDRGQQAGTVSANFYRVARSLAGGSKRARRAPAARAAAPAAASPPKRASNGSVGDQLASLIQSMVDESVDAAVDRRLKKLLT